MFAGGGVVFMFAGGGVVFFIFATGIALAVVFFMVVGGGVVFLVVIYLTPSFSFSSTFMSVANNFTPYHSNRS